MFFFVFQVPLLDSRLLHEHTTTITFFFALTIYANASYTLTVALLVMLLVFVFELTVSPPSLTFGTSFRLEIPCAVSLIKTDFTYQWRLLISMLSQYLVRPLFAWIYFFASAATV